jgi:hypothetical protein
VEWLLTGLAVLVVVAATLYLRPRPGRDEPRDQLPDGPLDRDRPAGPDARGAVNRNSWMLGGGGTGG